MQQINIPGVGLVNFPESMSDDDIKNAINTKILPKHAGNQAQNNVPSDTDSFASKLGQYGKDVANTGLNAVLGAGDAINNLPRALANMLAPKNMQAPMVQTGDPQNFGYTAGKIGGDIAGFFGGGEALDATRGASEVIPYIGKLAEMLGKSGIGESANRIAGSSLYGASQNPDDRTTGAIQGGIAGAVGEALPFAVKGVGSLAELSNPVEYTKQLAKSIAANYKKSTQEASRLYGPVLEKHGAMRIKKPDIWRIFTSADSPGIYDNLSSGIVKKYYDVGLKDLHNQFIKNPTFKNAHDLQSQLGIEIRGMQAGKSSQEAATRKEIMALGKVRSALQEDMNAYLEEKDPSMKQMYQEGSDLFREQVAPYRSNRNIQKIAEGKKQTISPTVLKNRLTEMKEADAFDSSHYLSQALNDITKKTQGSKAWSEIGSLLGGSALGTVIHPGIGTMTGMIAGHYLNKPLFNLAQNPKVQNVAEKSKSIYEPLAKAIISAYLSQQANP